MPTDSMYVPRWSVLAIVTCRTAGLAVMTYDGRNHTSHEQNKTVQENAVQAAALPHDKLTAEQKHREDSS